MPVTPILIKHSDTWDGRWVAHVYIEANLSEGVELHPEEEEEEEHEREGGEGEIDTRAKTEHEHGSACEPLSTPITTLREEVSAVLRNKCDFHGGETFTDLEDREMHVSLSRAIAFSYPVISSFVESLREALKGEEAFDMRLVLVDYGTHSRVTDVRVCVRSGSV